MLARQKKCKNTKWSILKKKKRASKESNSQCSTPFTSSPRKTTITSIQWEVGDMRTGGKSMLITLTFYLVLWIQQAQADTLKMQLAATRVQPDNILQKLRSFSLLVSLFNPSCSSKSLVVGKNSQRVEHVWETKKEWLTGYRFEWILAQRLS